MKVSELMAGKTPNPDYDGPLVNNSYILAIKTEDAQDTENDYIIARAFVTGYDSSLNPETTDRDYMSGKSTTRTGIQRSFSVTGDRAGGDDFQRYVMSHNMKFGVGADVETDYTYFCALTGIGEKGRCMISVESDQSGDASAPAGFTVNIRSVETPAEYTYTPTV